MLGGRGVDNGRGMSARRSWALPIALALVFALGAVRAAAVRADGDPASDVLTTQAYFVPVDAGFSDAQQARLTTLLGMAERARTPLRVAIVANAFDLGAVTEFWRRPTDYAHFLAVELSLVYRGPLLIVMPNGFGLNWPGHATAAIERRLARIHIEPRGEGLLNAVQTAVRELAADEGAAVGANGIEAAGGAHGGSSALEIVAAVAAATLLALSILAVLGRRRRGRPGARRTPDARVLASWLGWAAPVAVLAVAAVVIAHRLAPGTRRHAHRADERVEAPPSLFPAGRRRAPDFTLRDQDGRPVSIAAYRGGWVIVTFLDPLSPELDPLTTQILGAAERVLPAPQRPDILAVSVNAAGDARADLLRDSTKWHLGPQWRWAVGSPESLASVWKSYYAVVHVTTKKVEGTTVRYVNSSRMAYLIDGSGYERALFSWPYSAREVERTLLRLERP
jgi:protein SCO1